MDLLIAARTSDLARVQAYEVGRELAKVHPHLRIQFHFRQSLGDLNQDDPLWAMPEKGVFTQDFREGLRRGDWDLVVHSWKDLPTEAFPETEVVATLPRADSRDLFLFKPQHLDRVKSSRRLRVLSSSPRRAHNLKEFFQWSLPIPVDQVEFVPVRGNILTRIQKLQEGADEDGLIVAKAALDRLLSAAEPEFRANQEKLKLHLKSLRWQVLPLSVNPTAAAQGALAIEIRQDRQDLRQLLTAINCPQTWQSVHQERDQLKALGGGCHQKLGISHLQRHYGEFTWVRGESPGGVCLDNEVIRLNEGEVRLKNPYKGRLDIFKRERLSLPPLPHGANAHFVARGFALPETQTLGEGDMLWTAGLKTWQELAQRGHWVNGTSDSLGEAEEFGLENLAPGRLWLKWTHQDSDSSAWAHVVHSYRLVARPLPADLASYSEYFWMSGSQFREAITQLPKLLDARHFCGPGQTFTQIKEMLKQKRPQAPGPTILPSYSTWLRLTKDSP